MGVEIALACQHVEDVSATSTLTVVLSVLFCAYVGAEAVLGGLVVYRLAAAREREAAAKNV